MSPIKYSVTALDIMVCDYVHNHVRSMLDCRCTACIDTHTIHCYTGVDGDFMWMASDHNLKSVTRLMITSNTAHIGTAKIQVAVVN